MKFKIAFAEIYFDLVASSIVIIQKGTNFSFSHLPKKKKKIYRSHFAQVEIRFCNFMAIALSLFLIPLTLYSSLST